MCGVYIEICFDLVLACRPAPLACACASLADGFEIGRQQYNDGVEKHGVEILIYCRYLMQMF